MFLNVCIAKNRPHLESGEIINVQVDYVVIRNDQSGTLIFPTGKFIEIARLQDNPLRGYLFEKKSSPFDGVFSNLYQNRLEAKKRGDEPMTWIYKVLMNSLYRRFWINPKSTVIEICNHREYLELLKKDNFQSAEKLTDYYYVVNNSSNSSLVDDHNWKAPRMSPVQLAAIITACARIHMYPHIYRLDCYYTDIDSIILGSPLPDDLVSPVEIGKFKLENHVKKGIFLAPKSYTSSTED